MNPLCVASRRFQKFRCVRVALEKTGVLPILDRLGDKIARNFRRKFYSLPAWATASGAKSGSRLGFQLRDQFLLCFLRVRLNPLRQFHIRRRDFFGEVAMFAEKFRAASEPRRQNILVFEEDSTVTFAFQSCHPRVPPSRLRRRRLFGKARADLDWKSESRVHHHRSA